MRLRHIPGAEEAIYDCPAVIRNEPPLRGRWNEIFQNNFPLYAEIGMGKGSFLFGSAARNPGINFIGLERSASALVRAAARYDSSEFGRPENLRILCADAREMEEIFAPGELSKIYLNFPDPWPKARHADRRLTSAGFLERYERVLKSEGTLEFKTDNRAFFDFSLAQFKKRGWEIIGRDYDLYGAGVSSTDFAPSGVHNETAGVLAAGNAMRGSEEDIPDAPECALMTEYERKFVKAGIPICKLIARPIVLQCRAVFVRGISGIFHT